MVPPTGDQVALIEKKSGEVILAGKLQAEDDTVFAQRMDFSITPISYDSIARIEIRPRSDSEKIRLENPELSDETKESMVYAGMYGAYFLLVVFPIILLGWWVNKVAD